MAHGYVAFNPTPLRAAVPWSHWGPLCRCFILWIEASDTFQVAKQLPCLVRSSGG